MSLPGFWSAWPSHWASFRYLVLLRAWRAELWFALGIVRRAPTFIAAAFGHETLADVALRNARECPQGLALESGEQRLGYAELGLWIARAAGMLSEAGVHPGAVLPILGAGAPETIAVLLAAQWLGAAPLLIDAERGVDAIDDALASVQAPVRAAVCIAEPGLERVMARRVAHVLRIRFDAQGTSPYPRRLLPAALPPRASPHVDCAWVQTSGTTGHPKCSRVRQRRAMIAAHGFARLVFGFHRGDKVATNLSICHATGLLLGLGPALVSRTPLVMLGKFSASRYWGQVTDARATHWLCVGEMCRWLLRYPESEAERAHGLRMIVGMGFDTGLEAEIERRFRVSRIVEFYGASDGPLALVRLGGVRGSIGRVPMWARRYLVLARHDLEREDLSMDSSGYCVRAAVGERGELLIRQPLVPGSSLGCFEGYASESDASPRLLRAVFREGDCYFRTYDLARCDRHGFMYFEGRVGESIRWKGINIPAARVAAALAVRGVVADVVVYGVEIVGVDGTPPAAALVWEGEARIELVEARARALHATLRPRFIRVVADIERTATMRPRRARLAQSGVDPGATNDPLYVWLEGGYRVLDRTTYSALIRGEVRL